MLLTKYSVSEIKKDVMGSVCSTCEKKEIHILMGKPGDHLEDVGVDGKIILKWILNKHVGKREGGVDWIGLD